MISNYRDSKPAAQITKAVRTSSSCTTPSKGSLDFELRAENLQYFTYIKLQTQKVQANYLIRLNTESSTSVPDPVHPILQCFEMTQIVLKNSNYLKKN